MEETTASTKHYAGARRAYSSPRPYWALKRGVDVLASALGLLVLSPLFAILAIAINKIPNVVVTLREGARTLDPDFQEMLEGEANYRSSCLMFGGKLFTKEALDTIPEWDSIKLLKKRYKKSWVTTARRYVQFSHDLPMALVISTPWWKDIPDDQEDRCRHFIPSKKFMTAFACISPGMILQEIDDNTNERQGGPVGAFGLCLPDMNAKMHEFYAESFFNKHYIITFLVYQGKMKYI